MNDLEKKKKKKKKLPIIECLSDPAPNAQIIFGSEQ